MLGIDLSIKVYCLNINPKFKPVRKKCRTFNVEHRMVINPEVDKLLQANFIRESQYLEWITNVVLVKRVNDNWRVYVNLTDLSRACPKDSFSLPRIDHL